MANEKAIVDAAQDVRIIGNVAITVEDTTGYSRCEECGKVVPYDRLQGIWHRGVKWMVCGSECAETLTEGK